MDDSSIRIAIVGGALGAIHALKPYFWTLITAWYHKGGRCYASRCGDPTCEFRKKR